MKPDNQRPVDGLADGHGDERLAGGVANAGEVVRQGEFVIRPSNPHSGTIHSFLKALRTRGFEGAPWPLELQTDGRERLVFIEGDVPLSPFPGWAQSDETLASVAKLVCEFHAASAEVGVGTDLWSDELADPLGGPIICHNDVCLENVVFRHGEAIALLDFDFAAPGRPTFDLASFARMCVPIDDELSRDRLGWGSVDQPARLRMIADTYGLGQPDRYDLLDHLDLAMRKGGAFVQRRVEAGDLNFIRMLEAMGGMQRYERRRRWWESNRQNFAAALG
jgi:hypothetical protein